MALPSSPRYGSAIDWAALHSAEGARTIGSLFGFFDRGQHASSHAGADGYELSGDWVPDERAAWTLLNGNPRSLNLELCGFAHWTRGQWLSEDWVDGVWNPRQMIRHAAAWLRNKCDKHNIPKRLLTADEVGRGMRGIIDHARYTYGTGDGNHTDVGKNFPWDVLMNDVNGVDDMAGALDEPIQVWGEKRTTTLRAEMAWNANNFGRVHAGQAAILAAIAADKDLPPEQLNDMIDKAVEKHTPTAEQNAAAISGTLIPAVEEALRRVQDADNIDEAKQTVAELQRLIANAAPVSK